MYEDNFVSTVLLYYAQVLVNKSNDRLYENILMKLVMSQLSRL